MNYLQYMMDYTKALLRPYFALIINQPMLVNSNFRIRQNCSYTILYFCYSIVLWIRRLPNAADVNVSAPLFLKRPLVTIKTDWYYSLMFLAQWSTDHRSATHSLSLFSPPLLQFCQGHFLPTVSNQELKSGTHGACTLCS